jgi:hypothetical protein
VRLRRGNRIAQGLAAEPDAMLERRLGIGARDRRSEGAEDSDNYSTGDERRWWETRNIDPLRVAQRLWEESRKRFGVTSHDNKDAVGGGPSS